MFGHYLKYMRIKRGLNQAAMARKLFIAPCTLSHYETGSRLVPYTILLLAAEICNFKVQFFYEKEDRIVEYDEVKSLLEK